MSPQFLELTHIKVLRFKFFHSMSFSKIIKTNIAILNCTNWGFHFSFCSLGVNRSLRLKFQVACSAHMWKQECIPVGCLPPACCPYLPACTAPGEVYLVLGGVPGLGRGVHMVPGAGCVCTWSGGCTWSRGVCLVWGHTWSQGDT